MHGPMDTMSWFSDHGVELKVILKTKCCMFSYFLTTQCYISVKFHCSLQTEDDGRVFPLSNSSSTVIDCLMSEAKKRGGSVATTSHNFLWRSLCIII